MAFALTANPALGALAGALSVAGLPNLRDFKTKFKALHEQEEKNLTSPPGILFKHLK
jgi:hypothetical protein